MGRGIRGAEGKGEIVDRRGGEERLDLIERDFRTPGAELRMEGDTPFTNDPVPREVRRLAEEYDSYFSTPSQFNVEAVDYMTGGNQTHNQKAHYLTQEVLRILEQEREMSFDPAKIRRAVHYEMARFKINDGSEHNTNVLESDFPEIIDHVVSAFGGRESGPVSRVIETSEDIHWRIEELIEGELLETLRATLRTRLRAEFSSILMNEWGVERLEDVSDFLRDGIVVDFELRSLAVIEEANASSAVCEL